MCVCVCMYMSVCICLFVVSCVVCMRVCVLKNEFAAIRGRYAAAYSVYAT